ncbi:hypothetical protein JYB64_08890 [Algoriphagus aestuarii]|nr:hypothetical protein [Algoriphagus aestuarii]
MEAILDTFEDQKYPKAFVAAKPPLAYPSDWLKAKNGYQPFFQRLALSAQGQQPAPLLRQPAAQFK